MKREALLHLRSLRSPFDRHTTAPLRVSKIFIPTFIMISSQLFRCVSISSIYRISELGRSTNFGTKKLPKIILFEWSNLVNTLLKKNWRGDRGGQKNIVTKKMTKVYPVEAFCHQKMTKAYPAKAFSNQSLPSAYASSKPLQTRYHIKPIYYAVDHCLMAR